ncbi:MAG: nicotinamide-nucleotide amidohydrolase family protein [Treponema sp.]|nr:nicotinamide-nucleotide amidohydrolase family protein [Treponema sp.]
MNISQVQEKYNLLTKTLIHKKITITAMESCTSGLIASLITDTEGSSEIFKGSVVTYSNRAKIRMGVPSEIIEKFGVYSKETARAMASACRKAVSTDIGIGVTGTFGNVDPANKDSTVGQAFFAIDFFGLVKDYEIKLELESCEGAGLESADFDSTRFNCKLQIAQAIVNRLLSRLQYPLAPSKITDDAFRYDSFKTGDVLLNKKKNHLPAMGWNSWNAFGSGNTEALTKAMADKIVELGLEKLGYKFVVLDDGCYRSERVDGKLANETVKFPSGFKSLSNYIHSKGLKFGMYNDIGTNLCAGAEVGTCGHEKVDAQSYVDWGVDFLKIDNCYYLWDNATFSNPENARYVFAPNIRGITISGKDFAKSFSAVNDGELEGEGGIKTEYYVMGIGTFDGTNTGITPIGPRSSELVFNVDVPCGGLFKLTIDYATGKKNGTGQWLQLAVGQKIFYDYFLPSTDSEQSFTTSAEIIVEFEAGKNKLRLMNHRRQENTLCSYAAMLEGLNLADPNHDIILSLCEWGKTQPQNWGYKVADSWRILNDITFRVGSDGDAGFGAWSDGGTPSVTSQYNKAVVMDEFAGLDKGWNDPDMLMLGMKGLTPVMNKTHFTMWCMMNSPLMLGMDLRRVCKEGDGEGKMLYNIITNKKLIDLNQDKLGIQAKRIFTTAPCQHPDKEYIQDNERVDILKKPLADGSFALSIINLSEKNASAPFSFSLAGVSADDDGNTEFTIEDLWTGKVETVRSVIQVPSLQPCDNITLKVTAR